VSASFAWAVAPADALTVPELLERADQRLLDRKRLNKV
jgi:predicted signal transduction protein with EAL and GGDEF domain